MKGKMLFDGVRRIKVAEHEIERLALRYLAKNTEIPTRTRMLAQLQLAEMPAAWSINRISRRCTLTGRGRSIIREFNISRMRFREFALAGRLNGISKASW